MNTLQAFAIGQASKDKEQMVFDWDRAAERIRQVRPHIASAGLQADWEWTGGDIYRDGSIVEDEYTFLSSSWATPELSLDGVVEPCYRPQHEVPDWDADTKWPSSARAILV